MLADIWTVTWKETKLLLEGNNRSRLWPVIFLIIFGVILPLQTGRNWIKTPVGVAFWALIPLIMVSSLIADSFAGERERHSLETLLASRLSDRAILLGKIAAAAGYAWLMAVAAMLLGLLTANVANWQSGVQLYPPVIGLGGMGLSLLIATLASNAGVLITIRATTVRQAQQTVGIGVMVLVWIPIIVFNLLPREWKRALGIALQSADLMQIVLVVVAVLLLLDVVLLAAAMARFRRSVLILD